MKSKHKYIVRDKIGNAWRVKIRIGEDYSNRSFNIAVYRSVKIALAAAIEWRDNELKRANLLYRLSYDKAPDYFSNKSNVGPCVGVYMTSVLQDNGKRFYNWSARYSIEGVEQKKHFSINKYGGKAAFQKACKVRYEHCGMLRVIGDLPFRPKVPCTRV